MLIVGNWDHKLEKVLNDLHVPVDGIMQGIVKDRLEEVNPDNRKFFKAKKAWSQLDSREYNKYQKTFREFFEKDKRDESKPEISPTASFIEWEFIVWTDKRDGK